MKKRVALVGGRGYVGEALIGLLLQHPHLEIAWLASRSLAGRPVQSVFPDLKSSLEFEAVTPADVKDRHADAIVLALPNGEASQYIRELCPQQKVIDVSADYRFDDAWCYGLPELNRDKIQLADRISNPGCYSTAVQLGLAPLVPYLAEVPTVFGVSGYSGAGRTPSARNDPKRLSENLIPYSLTGHIHEAEASFHLKQAIRFIPHVAAFFRGISVTISATLNKAVTERYLFELFMTHYADETLMDVRAEIPEIRDVARTCQAHVGGFSVDKRDGHRVTLICCLDNLLKGAASQALQNLNLMFGIDEFTGLTDEQPPGRELDSRPPGTPPLNET